MRRGWDRVVDLAIPIGVLAVMGTAAGGIALGVIRDGDAYGLVLPFVACGGGTLLAIVLKLRATALDAPDAQALGRHPGWFRFGPVGGVGGVMGILGFLIIALLRAPLFIPVVLVVVPLGAATAVLLRRSRRSRVELTTLPSHQETQPTPILADGKERAGRST